MTHQRPSRGQPGPAAQPRPEEPARVGRPRPSELEAAARARTTRRIALAGLVVAVVALGLAGWQALGSRDGSCQSRAWDAAPSVANLPDGWTVGATQYDIDRATYTLLGPAPVDEASAQAVVYVTVSCFATDAAEAVTRSADAATAAGQAVSQRTDLGDQAFEARDDSGALFVQFRHDRVVAYLAASGDATRAEVNALAGAFDIALGGDGAAAAVGTLEPSGAVPSEPAASDPVSAPASPPASAGPAPSEGAAAADLEALLPAAVGDVSLTVDSALGTDVLGADQISRAITAALRDAGHTAEDLRVAQAYDESQATDLLILVVSVDGMDRGLVREFVIGSWLSAGGAGMTSSTVTLAGREFTRLDYGDEGTANYVTQAGDAVIVIESADATLVEEAAAALP